MALIGGRRGSVVLVRCRVWLVEAHEDKVELYMRPEEDARGSGYVVSVVAKEWRFRQQKQSTASGSG